MKQLKMQSPNFTRDNIALIRELFPTCVTEGKGEDGRVKLMVDFDQLRQELSESIVEGSNERYHLNWPGKRDALLMANAPIAKTLRPVHEESVDFEATKNLFIEGDNLDALKLLQETFLGKVKMIYIDPPYNTGNDFIYEDNFAEGVDEYLRRSNQEDDQGNRLVANTAANGRFHSDWLSLIYPRIKLARNLLAEDGFIFVSIDDVEADNLKKILDEVFGNENFVGKFVWKSRVSEDTRAVNGLSTDHEYIICYANSNSASLRGTEKDLEKFKNTDGDVRGPWRSADMTGLATRDKRPNLHYDLINPKTGINYGCPPKGWRFEPDTMKVKISENRILWPSTVDGRPRQKLFLNEMDSIFKNISSVILDVSTGEGTREVNSLMGSGVFSFPKPTRLIEIFLEQATGPDSIVLDFFAGSASTAHAVMKKNCEDGGTRRFILVQVPEPCAEDSEAFKAGYKTIAEVSKDRIRRAGKQISESKKIDAGFRVLRIDTSNMAEIYYAPDALLKDNLDLFVDNIKPDRAAEDLLFQVMLDWGVDLALPIEKRAIEGRDVFFVDGNALVACFDAHGGIDEAFVKELATYKPLRVVFRDAGFKDSAVKINVEQIFKLLSPATEVKSI
ncbi:site-specific DNA-methyltransferase [Burkholderia anthina]|uniref:site-specific DNA-methyltransferase n=1 Tax=Burkholderia anthina TaxID=179879 RepID=UPI00158A3614|nr:site-specific DNA-methyltransferase [Burkholderia anthina]